jgi:hypothetical protein
MVTQVILWKYVDWTYLAHDRIQWQARSVSPFVMVFVMALSIIK